MRDCRAFRDAVLAILDEWRAAYPEDVFPPLSVPPKFSNASPDRIGAAMARHVAMEVRRQVIAAWEARGA